MLIVGIKLVEDHELLSERALGLMIHISCIIDTLRNFYDLSIDFVHFWNLVSISIERIANTEDLISNEITVPEHDKID